MKKKNDTCAWVVHQVINSKNVVFIFFIYFGDLLFYLLTNNLFVWSRNLICLLKIVPKFHVAGCKLTILLQMQLTNTIIALCSSTRIYMLVVTTCSWLAVQFFCSNNMLYSAREIFPFSGVFTRIQEKLQLSMPSSTSNNESIRLIQLITLS